MANKFLLLVFIYRTTLAKELLKKSEENSFFTFDQI